MMQRNQDAKGEMTEVGVEGSPPQQKSQQDDELARIEPKPMVLAAPLRKEEDPHHFPTKLHRMLCAIDDDPKYESMKELISWQPHGRCFIIRHEKNFIDKVMPHFFRVIKFSSFRRQLHLFGFRKLSRQGPDKGSYFHDSFVKDKPELAALMKPVKGGHGKRGRKPRSEDLDASFYAQGGAGRMRGMNDASNLEELRQAGVPMEGMGSESESSHSQRLSGSGNSQSQRLSASDRSFASGYTNNMELRQLESVSGKIPNTQDLRQLAPLSGQASRYQQSQMNFRPAAADRRLRSNESFSVQRPFMSAMNDMNSFHASNRLLADLSGHSGLHTSQADLAPPQDSLQALHDQTLGGGAMRQNSSFFEQQQMQMFDQQQRMSMQQQMMASSSQPHAQAQWPSGMDFSGPGGMQQRMFPDSQGMNMQFNNSFLQQQQHQLQQLQMQEEILRQQQQSMQGSSQQQQQQMLNHPQPQQMMQQQQLELDFDTEAFDASLQSPNLQPHHDSDM